jgi:hypothetical protein
MRNLVLTFLFALLVVWTALSVRRMVAGNVTSTGQKPTLLAIGVEPVPWPPPHLRLDGGRSGNVR